MTGLDPQAPGPTETRTLSHQCRSALSLQERHASPTPRPPFWSKKPRRSPCNAPTNARADLDRQWRYPIQPVEEVIWEISAQRRPPDASGLQFTPNLCSNRDRMPDRLSLGVVTLGRTGGPAVGSETTQIAAHRRPRSNRHTATSAIMAGTAYIPRLWRSIVVS